MPAQQFKVSVPPREKVSFVSIEFRRINVRTSKSHLKFAISRVRLFVCLIVCLNFMCTCTALESKFDYALISMASRERYRVFAHPSIRPSEHSRINYYNILFWIKTHVSLKLAPDKQMNSNHCGDKFKSITKHSLTHTYTQHINSFERRRIHSALFSVNPRMFPSILLLFNLSIFVWHSNFVIIQLAYKWNSRGWTRWMLNGYTAHKHPDKYVRSIKCAHKFVIYLMVSICSIYNSLCAICAAAAAIIQFDTHSSFITFDVVQ